MIDDFSFLTDWEDRYTHVIDMGRQLPALTEAERNPATKVNGCVSQVWLVSEFENGKLDAEAILGKLDLSEHLSPQRSNGLKAMIARIKAEAERVSA